MIKDALQNAVDGVWVNTIGRVIGWLPDWLVWLFSYPADVWALWAIALVVGYVLGRWGFVALAAIGGLLIAVFTLGRRSKSAPGTDEPPIPKPDVRAERPKTLLERIFKRKP